MVEPQDAVGPRQCRKKLLPIRTGGSRWVPRRLASVAVGLAEMWPVAGQRQFDRSPDLRVTLVGPVYSGAAYAWPDTGEARPMDEFAAGDC